VYSVRAREILVCLFVVVHEVFAPQCRKRTGISGVSGILRDNPWTLGLVWLLSSGVVVLRGKSDGE
jgi:hypothetical protein